MGYQKSQSNNKPAIILLVIIGLVTWFFVFSKSSENGNNPPETTTTQSQPQAPQPKAKFEGKIVSYEAINPATLQFVSEVKNTGDAEGKFSCTVRGKDDSSTYTGFDFFEDEDGSLKSGETRTFNGVITIKKEGAYFVTDVSVSCT